MAELTDKTLPIDVSLMDGLAATMTEEEQRYVTKNMTSGEPNRLAQAARFLSHVADLARLGIGPSRRTSEQTKKARAAMEQTDYTNEVAVRKAMIKGDDSAVKTIRLEEAEIKAKKRLHPLPSRMPRHITIGTFNPDSRNAKGGILGTVGVPSIDVGPIKTPIGKGPLGKSVPPTLALVDAKWDGTVDDAFGKISVSSDGKVTVAKVQSLGVSNILGGHSIMIGPKDSNRVVIFGSANDAAKKGLRKGDVITHVNGEAVEGKTSEEVLSIFRKIHAEGSSESMDIVVGAELCVAEALRLRSIC